MKWFGRGLAVFLVSIVAATALLVLWPARSGPLPETRASRLIENVRIVDVVSGTTGPLVSIEIRDGTITAIGPALVAGDLPTVDGRGAYVTPGFWDMHVHSFQLSPQMHFPLWIANGVTNVRDMMDCPEEQDALIACFGDKRRWNDNVEAGRMAAPRIVEVASYYFESLGLRPAEARARVNAYAARGLPAIKVYNRLSPATYQAIAGEARLSGMRLVGHLPKAVALEDALRAGQVSFEHAHVLSRSCAMDAEQWRTGKLDSLPAAELTQHIVANYDPVRCKQTIDAMARAGVWYVPTHVTREEDARAHDPSYLNDPRLKYLDPLSRWAWTDDLGGTRNSYAGKRGAQTLSAYFEHGLRLTADAQKAGVGVLVGTDTSLGGFRFHDEMAHLVRAGLSPAHVLRAATIDAARYVGQDKLAGSVEIGKRADLILLEADPLVDIANTRRIRAVVHKGRLYDRVRLDALLQYVRSEANSPDNWAKLLWGFARSSVRSDL